MSPSEQMHLPGVLRKVRKKRPELGSGWDRVVSYSPARWPFCLKLLLDRVTYFLFLFCTLHTLSSVEPCVAGHEGWESLCQLVKVITLKKKFYLFFYLFIY